MKNLTKRESGLMQELGPKKYYEKVEKANREYDRYKAGKIDPKTGIRYNEIHYTNPAAKKPMGPCWGDVECGRCGKYFTIKKSTVMVICSHCKCKNSIKFNEDKTEVEILTDSVEPFETNNGEKKED